MTLTALLVYEWCITFSDEVNLFWKNKKSLATFIFLLNRYLPLIFEVVTWLDTVALSEEVRNLCVCVAWSLAEVEPEVYILGCHWK